MNCSNCGAAMARLESRYFRFEHGGSSTFRRHSKRTASGLTIIRLLHQDVRSVVSVWPTHLLDDQHPLDFCACCRGVLLFRRTFALVTNRVDFGEMRQIVDAPGKDRGSSRVLGIDEEFIRQGRHEAVDEDENGSSVEHPTIRWGS